MSKRFSFRSIAKPTLLAAAAVTPLVATPSNATAGWSETLNKIRLGYHRNNAWPDPFNEADAIAVVTPFERMKVNGWRMYNTLSHELFREGDGVLLAAGNNRVHWIATQAPEQRRQIYVLRGRSEEETQSRLASVRDSLDGLPSTNSRPQVLVTDTQPASSSGDWVSRVNRSWMENLPEPKLPSTSVTGAGGATQ